MKKRDHRQIVSIIEQRHYRHYLWIANLVAFFVMISSIYGTPAFDRIVPTEWHHSVVYGWELFLIFHLIYVIIQDVRGWMLKRQIEARYGWDSPYDESAEKRKPMYYADDELTLFDEPNGEKLKRTL